MTDSSSEASAPPRAVTPDPATRDGAVDEAHDQALLSFFTGFSEVSELAHHYARRSKMTGPPLAERLAEHLGFDPVGHPVVAEELSVFRVADADVALAAMVADSGGGEIIGVGGGDQRWHQTLTELLSRNHFSETTTGAIDYTSVSVGPDEERSVVSFGMHLFRFPLDGIDHPVAVLQRGAKPSYGAAPKLEILAPAGVAPELVTRLHDLMNELSVLRGQVISFAPSEFEAGMSMGSAGAITFQRRPDVPAEAVILPEGRLDRVRRHVLGIADHREALTAAGQHLKRGVLLYGPPGTGKTHTVRHLISQAEGTTVILLSGRFLSMVTMAAQTARALQPSIVVLEDCDLVAHERSHHESSPLLFEVLDALDGLTSDSDVVFLLTTNRVEALEPALAQRPGRVDLAVEIPKPDQHARRTLLDLYAANLGFSLAALDSVAAAAEGTTASFVKELVRRSVLTAAERGESATDADLEEACAEMMNDTSTISRALLGTVGRSGGMGFGEAVRG